MLKVCVCVYMCVCVCVCVYVQVYTINHITIHWDSRWSVNVLKLILGIMNKSMDII